jgi:hypothetical protein
MGTDLIRFFLRAVLGLSLGWAGAAFAQAPASCAPPSNRPFRVFDGLNFTGKPDLSRLGLAPIHIVDRGIWRDENDRASRPDPALVRQYLERLPNDGAPVVLDIEDFDPAVADTRAADAAIAQLTRIHSVFDAVGAQRRYGYYSMIPGRDYWRAVKGPGSPEYRAWQRENDRLAPLERRMDIIFPSLYAFYDDPAGWVTYATAQICEARRLSSKPVYVFLWFEFHPGSMAAGQFIPAAFWRLQLETVRRLADGVVIWGGYDAVGRRLRNWDPEAPWWRETERFMGALERRRD